MGASTELERLGLIDKQKLEKLLSLIDLDSDLLTIVINEPTDGQTLTYDGTSGKWKNADATGGGSSGGAVYIEYDSELDYSFNDIKALVESGNVVVLVKSESSTDGYYYLSQMADVISIAGYAIVTFYGSDPDSGQMGTVAFTGTTLDAKLSVGS